MNWDTGLSKYDREAVLFITLGALAFHRTTDELLDMARGWDDFQLPVAELLRWLADAREAKARVAP